MRINLNNAISFKIIDEINVGHEAFIGNIIEKEFFRYCSESENYFCKSRIVVDFGLCKRTIWFKSEQLRDKFVAQLLPRDIPDIIITETNLI